MAMSGVKPIDNVVSLGMSQSVNSLQTTFVFTGCHAVGILCLLLVTFGCHLSDITRTKTMNSLGNCKVLMKTNLLTRLKYNDVMQNNSIWNFTVCRCCSQGKMVEKTAQEPNFIQKDKKGPSVDKHVLSTFEKRLLYTCGKYPSVAAVPNYAGESELRYATDVCKTLFNIWCMMFLSSFFLFVHFIEKRRLRRMFARSNRREQLRMREFDKINKEAQEKKLKSVSVAS